MIILRKREGQGERIVEGASAWLDSGTSRSWGRRGLRDRCLDAHRIPPDGSLKDLVEEARREVEDQEVVELAQHVVGRQPLIPGVVEAGLTLLPKEGLVVQAS